MNNKFLVIGASPYQHYIYKTLKKSGFMVYSVDGNPNSPMFNYCDNYSAIDIYDVGHIIKYIKQNDIDFVSAINLDQGMFALNKVCRKIGLPYFSTDKLLVTTNKEKMRRYWESIAVNVPKYKIFLKGEFDKFEEFYKTRSETKWIIKPVDNAAKRGLGLICGKQTRNSLIVIFNAAIKESKIGKCIVEEFIKGELFFVPTYISKNRARAGLFKQKYNKNFVQIRFDAPAKMSDKEKKDIKEEAIRAVKHLGDGFYHTEVIYSKQKGPVIIETSPRISYATVALSKIVDNFDPVVQLIKDVTGKKLSTKNNFVRAKYASLIHVVPNPGKIYNGHYDYKQIKKAGLFEVVPLVEKGHRVKAFKTNADRVLYFVCYANSLLNLNKRIKFYKKEICCNAFK